MTQDQVNCKKLRRINTLNFFCKVIFYKYRLDSILLKLLQNVKFHVFLINNLKFPITVTLNNVTFFYDSEIKRRFAIYNIFSCLGNTKEA